MADNPYSLELKPGDLVLLTAAYEDYVFQRFPSLRVRLVNRLAKLEEIIDWDSSKGKKIKIAREKTGKWKNLPLEDCKYIFSVFYHELIGRNNQPGVIERGVCLFEKDPKTGARFFEKVPAWIYSEIMKQCTIFDVELKSDVSGSDNT